MTLIGRVLHKMYCKKVESRGCFVQILFVGSPHKSFIEELLDF